VAGGGATYVGIDGRPHRDRIWLTIGMRIVSTTPKMICRLRCWAAVRVSMDLPRSGFRVLFTDPIIISRVPVCWIVTG